MATDKVTYASCDFCNADICVCGGCDDKSRGHVVQIATLDVALSPYTISKDVCESCVTEKLLPVIAPEKAEEHAASKVTATRSGVPDNHPTKRKPAIR